MWMEVLCWIYWSSKECACCTCDPSVHLSVPAVGFVYVIVSRLGSWPTNMASASHLHIQARVQKRKT